MTAPARLRFSGSALAKARDASGMTQLALAAAVGAELGCDVWPQAISLWENDKATPDIDQAYALAHILGVELVDLGARVRAGSAA